MTKPLKQRRCWSCKELYTPKRIGLKITKVCLESACVLNYAQGIKEKAARSRKADYYSNDLPKQLEISQKVFNKLRRLQELKWFADRNMEPICISCSKPKGGDIFCAGHFKTRGAQSGLRFDPLNVWLQHNRRCNSDLSGDIYGTKTTHGYLQGIRNRFGEEEGNRIIEYCNSNTQTIKWNCGELKENRKQWSKEIRELEKQIGIN